MTIRPRPWLMLMAAVLAQAAAAVVTLTPAFLIPYLQESLHLTLAEAGLIAAAPNLGLVLTPVLWGAATDRWGERRVLLTGLTATVVAVGLSMLASDLVWLGFALVLAGGMAGCTSSTSGRLVVGWFPPRRRGTAMGFRQTSMPLGAAVGAIVVPALAESASITWALAFGGILCAVSVLVCAIVVSDPPRPPRTETAQGANPYRGNWLLVRIHAVSVFLVVPQFTLATFGLVWFISVFGWSGVTAGLVVAAAQLLGAVGRIAIGVVSDRVGSRLGPLRWVAVAGVVSMLATAALGALDWAVPAAIAYVIASCISVADNGLSFTVVAERAGPQWAGRALGIQNTGQFIGATIIPPVMGAVIGVVGYPLAWAIVAAAPLLAVPLVPSTENER